MAETNKSQMLSEAELIEAINANTLVSISLGKGQPQKNVTLSTLATVVAGIIENVLFPTKTYTLAPGEEVDTGFSNYGLYLMRTTSVGQTAIVLIGTSPSVSVIMGSEATFTTDLTSTTSRFIVNRKESNGNIFVKNITTVERQFQIKRFRII